MTDKEKYETLKKMTTNEHAEFMRQEDLRTPQKISSHSSWYRGTWQKDICHCGQILLIPFGKQGIYQCNSCADMAEGLCD